MCNIYVRPTHEFRLNSDQLLRLLKPLYGLFESGDYWHETFFRHLQHDLRMQPTAGDFSFFVKVVSGKLQGMMGTYVDDTLCAGTNDFHETSTATERKFESKERKYDSFTLACIQVDRSGDEYLPHQEKYINRITELSKDCTFAEFRSRRQTLAWLTNTRPNICAAVNPATQVTEESWTTKDIKNLNKTVRYVKSTPRRRIRQHKLDRDTLSIKVFLDSSFANTRTLHSQLGFLFYYAMLLARQTSYILRATCQSVSLDLEWVVSVTLSQMFLTTDTVFVMIWNKCWAKVTAPSLYRLEQSLQSDRQELVNH